MILKGKGGEKKDEAAAFAWCKKAADQGFGPAETQLATMYERGEGVQADSEQALVWSTLAAKQQEKIAERQRGGADCEDVTGSSGAGAEIRQRLEAGFVGFEIALQDAV